MFLKMMIDFVDKRLEKPIRTEYLGPQIKRKRKEQDKTQEEIAKGICCISYLSKLENGQMSGNYSIISEMMRKLDMETSIIDNVEKYRDYIEYGLKAVVKNDTNGLEELYTKVLQDGDIYYADIIRLTYYIYYQNIDAAKPLISNLFLVKETLDDNELICFMLCMGKYYYLKNEFLKSHTIYKQIERFSFNSRYAKLLLNQGLFYTSIKIGRFVNLSAILKEYIDFCLYTNEYQRLAKAETVFSLILIYLKEIDKGKVLFDHSIDGINQNDIKIYHMHYHIFLGEFTEALKFMDPTDDELLYLSLFCYDKLNDKEKIMEILKKIKLNNLHITKQIFVESINEKYNDTKTNNYKKYIRETAFPFVYSHNDYIWAHYFGNELIGELKKDASYKEATIIHHKLEIM